MAFFIVCYVHRLHPIFLRQLASCQAVGLQLPRLRRPGFLNDSL